MAPMTYDVIVKGGRWFDGTGAPSQLRDIGVRDGRVVAVSEQPLDETGCARVVDATDKWVLPGMLDIHTHYDVEVLEGPDLVESLRHGVTTIFVGSCSLSTIHVDPVTAGDLFGRVEAIPRRFVIDTLRKHQGWSSAAEYVEALESLPLGPNLAAFIGHSDIRAAVMGLDRATRKSVTPSEREIATMEAQLTEALDAGFIGMSAQELTFDKLDGDIARSRTLPSTYARGRERRRLNALLRKRRRALQGGPDIANPLSIGRMTLGSLPVRGGTLKTSLLSAADLKANPFLVHIMGPIAKAVNALGGDFRWQHLPVPFEVYADGIDLVIFEEFGTGATALHLQEKVAREELMRDPAYRAAFRKDYESKYGPRVWHRDFFDADIVACPDASHPHTILLQAFGSIGWRRPALKTSLLSAADIKAIPFVIHLLRGLSSIVNRLGGDFRFQHLPVPFEVYADGIDLVIFEEFGSGATALHLQEAVARDELFRSEEYRRAFRKDYESKYGPRVWHRDFFDAEIVACPDASIVGKSFGQVGVERGGLHPVDAFLDLVLEHGTAIRWRTTISNHRPAVLKKLAADSGIQIGFSDAGAHLRNMAFYNFGLRLLRHVRDAERAGKPFMTVEHAVHRLTGELGEWYRIDAGTLRVGDRADLVVVDPARLDDAVEEYHEAPVEQYGGLSRMVNRNDAAVPAVFIAGRRVVENGQPTAVLGHERTGRFLRAEQTSPAAAHSPAPSVPAAS